MYEHVFLPEMMYEREKQLMSALSDCADVYCDINFTKNRIIGTAVQKVDGVPQSPHEQIGMQDNCRYTEWIDVWSSRLVPEERSAFLEFFDIDHMKKRYAEGERLLSYRYQMQTVPGDSMPAVQKLRLYEDCLTGDLLGLTYVSDERKYEAMQKKEKMLTARYEEASGRVDFLETMSANVPGGYHRCGVGDGFPLEFVSDSFLKIVGWTREDLRKELDNRFINLVAPEDRDLFMSYEPALVQDGQINVAYRIRRKDGSYRWVQDATMHVEKDGREYYQCILADITDFVNQQEELSRRNLELMQKKILMEVMEENMPSGYHRCEAKEGCPFSYIGKHFTDIVGFTKEEIEKNFGNLYRNLIWDEDVSVIHTYEDMMERQGKGNVYDTSVYRVKHKDGGYRWVTDSTMFVDMGEDSFFQSTVVDISEYMNCINEARERAEASNLAKSTFLFNASHDIRTPMNAIKGFAHMIEQNLDNPKIVGDTVRKIQQASDTLMTLMNDILDLARIERGKEEINAETVHLQEHGRNLYEMFASDMKQAGLRFHIEGEIQHTCVLCDPLKLTRIGMNMLSNAKKFTSPGGSVVFGIRELHSDEISATYCLYTRDTGIGMSKEFQKRAFEQFERERTSTESGVNGSGLGLAIIKKLVELMGGQVKIDSELGKGTEISATLTFPLVREQERKQEAINLQKLDMAGKRVLLVEDNDFNREIARYILEDMQFSVEEAENGSVCVDKLLRSEPGYYDLILMDIQMPVMDGYKATMEIRNLSDPALASIPIIAMTANAFEEDRQRCFAAGMNGHIGKPIEMNNLIRELTGIM